MWYLIVALAAFVIGAFSWPHIKLQWAVFTADPLKTIERDIKRLRDLKAKYLGGTNPPPSGGMPA